MIKVDTFLIWFFMPIFVGCAKYQIENNTPIFLDTERGYGRIYTAEKIEPSECGDPDYKFTYSKKNIPINEMNEMRFQNKVALTKEEFEALATKIQQNL